MKTVRALLLARGYSPRHAAPVIPWWERLRPLWGRMLALWGRLDAAMEKDMSGPALVLCGALMGLILWPVVLYCFMFP